MKEFFSWWNWARYDEDNNIRDFWVVVFVIECILFTIGIFNGLTWADLMMLSHVLFWGWSVWPTLTGSTVSTREDDSEPSNT